MISRQWILTCALLSAASVAQGTSVVPLALPELAEQADAIVRVKVLDQGARRGVFHDAPAIVTDLEFQILEVLKGEAPNTLTVFGGTVGDQTLALIGQPTLRAGDEAFLFLITKEEVTCPFVGIWQGVYPVRAGQVWREGSPVVDVVDGEVAFGEDHERGMSARSFAAEVRRSLVKLAAQPRVAPLELEREARPGRLEIPGPTRGAEPAETPRTPRLIPLGGAQ